MTWLVIERYLARDLAFKMAHWHLHQASLCLRNSRIPSERTTFWLEEASRHSDHAWHRMDELP